MEHDSLKKYIDNHREAFDDEALPVNMLGGMQNRLKQRKVVKSRLVIFKYVAAAAVVVGIFTTILLLRNADSESSQVYSKTIDKSDSLKSITAITAPPPLKTNKTTVDSKMPSGVKMERQAGQKNEISSTKRAIDQSRPTRYSTYDVIYTALKDSASTASRLKAVLKIGEMQQIDNQFKNALCQTLIADDNENVRLAALDVLSRFQEDPQVISTLQDALTSQSDPLVQIELARLLARSDNIDSRSKLVALLSDNNVREPVKEEVYLALTGNKLSTAIN